MGSNIEVKNAPVAKQASVTDILETLMALKKVNQCNAIINPANKKESIVLAGSFKGIFLMITYTKIKPLAKSILNQTKGKASNEIKAPKIAVNPQIKTIK